MNEIWQILAQFIFRLTFGVALAMAITPSRLVTSGFYRVHLWVLMALNAFAALSVYSARESYDRGTADWRFVLALAIFIAVASYFGSVMWLCEKKRAGTWVLFVLAVTSILAAAFASDLPASTDGLKISLLLLDLASGGLLLGSILSAMLLGHWYLNTPTMELVPLKRLVLFMVAAIIARAMVSGFGLSMLLGSEDPVAQGFVVFLALRWLSGLMGTLMLAVLTWRTLKIPNTQSATGILYAGVILAFIGELTSMLLSVSKPYPV